MHIACPNCSSEYDVPDDLIPSAGRKVKCEVCENVWTALPVGAAEDKRDAPEKMAQPEDPEDKVATPQTNAPDKPAPPALQAANSTDDPTPKQARQLREALRRERLRRRASEETDPLVSIETLPEIDGIEIDAPVVEADAAGGAGVDGDATATVELAEGVTENPVDDGTDDAAGNKFEDAIKEIAPAAALAKGGGAAGSADAFGVATAVKPVAGEDQGAIESDTAGDADLKIVSNAVSDLSRRVKARRDEYPAETPAQKHVNAQAANRTLSEVLDIDAIDHVVSGHIDEWESATPATQPAERAEEKPKADRSSREIEDPRLAAVGTDAEASSNAEEASSPAATTSNRVEPGAQAEGNNSEAIAQAHASATKSRATAPVAEPSTPEVIDGVRINDVIPAYGDDNADDLAAPKAVEPQAGALETMASGFLLVVASFAILFLLRLNVTNIGNIADFLEPAATKYSVVYDQMVDFVQSWFP